MAREDLVKPTVLKQLLYSVYNELINDPDLMDSYQPHTTIYLADRVVGVISTITKLPCCWAHDIWSEIPGLTWYIGKPGRAASRDHYCMRISCRDNQDKLRNLILKTYIPCLPGTQLSFPFATSTDPEIVLEVAYASD